MRKHLLALLFCLMLSPSAAPAENLRPKIAILPFDNDLPRPLQPLSEGMADILTACFSSYPAQAQILDRSALEALSDEQQLNFKKALTGGKSVSGLGHLQSATHILRGILLPQNDGYMIHLMLYDLASAKLAASAEATGDMGDITGTACKSVEALVGKIGAMKDIPATGASMNKKQTEQNRRLIEGLGYYYNGAYEKAFSPFMKMAKADPADPVAGYWLAKSYLGAGMTEAARVELKKFLKNFPADPRSGEMAELLAQLDKEQKHGKN